MRNHRSATIWPTAHSTVNGVLCTLRAKYKVANNVPKYTEVNGSLSFEKRCLKWFMGPHKNPKLQIRNKLPKVYNKANFLALRSKRGVYNPAKMKQKIPIPIHMQNPIILCIRLIVGQQSLCPSEGENQPFCVSSLFCDFENHFPTAGGVNNFGIAIFVDVLSFLDR